jgi:hypothetical protein
MEEGRVPLFDIDLIISFSVPSLSIGVCIPEWGYIDTLKYEISAMK